MIEVDDLAVHYGAVQAVAGVDLDARDGHVTGLVGPNGSGKSTLLRAVAAAVRLARGRAAVDGDDVQSLPPRERAVRLASVAQEEHNEFPLTVWESVLLGRSVHRAVAGAPTPRLTRTPHWTPCARPASPSSPTDP